MANVLLPLSKILDGYQGCTIKYNLQQFRKNGIKVEIK